VPTGKSVKRPDIATNLTAVDTVAPVRRMGEFARAVSALPSRRSLRASDRDLAELLLAELRAASSQDPPAFVSVDIFDTLLLRNDKCEARRFWEISDLVRQSLASAGLRGALSTRDLFITRCLAMRAGYACSDSLLGCREGHVLQVLATQVELLGLPANAQVLLLEAELEFETGNLQSNDFLLAVLQEAFPGTPLIGLSDTYLGGAQIQTLVDRLCAGRCRMHALYSSADIIVSKRSGHAFTHVARDRNATCAEFLHIGDSVAADVIQARRAGWRAQLFPLTHAEADARARDLEAFVEERRREGLPCENYVTL